LVELFGVQRPSVVSRRRFDVRINGLAFVGTRTVARETMSRFVQDVLGLAPTGVSGIDADLFELPDGSIVAVAPTDDPTGERTVGFMVEDLDAACAELREGNVEVDDSIAANERFRYVHFRAPDGKLYELVEARSD
jgi:catechol 2,3-dioxygenase-like lactoylglutathione lyase family enzyme